MGRLDPASLGDLYDRHGALAYGLAIRLTGDARCAEDVVCDAFVWLARAGHASGDADSDGGRRRVVAAVASAAMRLARSAPTGPELSIGASRPA